MFSDNYPDTIDSYWYKKLQGVEDDKIYQHIDIEEDIEEDYDTKYKSFDS